MKTNRSSKINRRTFLVGSAAVLGGVALSQVVRMLVKGGVLADQTAYLPLITNGDGTTPSPTVTGITPQATNTPTITASSIPTLTPTPTATNPGPTSTNTPTPTATATTPVGSITPGPDSHKVVHIRGAGVSSWQGSGNFYEYVDQALVTNMVQAGLQELTGQASWGAIWGQLFSRVSPYAPGKKIAIKVNFNNTIYNGNGCTTHNSNIDALPQPIIGLLTGLTAAGVSASDVILYDASGEEGGARKGKPISSYFRNPITAAFPGVTFVGENTCEGVIGASYGKDSSLTVNFPGIAMNARQLADVLYDATYVINNPILKVHGSDGAIPVSLGFKNHLGSIDYVYSGGSEGAPNCFHAYINPTQGLYNQNANPLVTLYQHPCIGGKTILTLGDGLFGTISGANSSPWPWWGVFGGQLPSSLFFATDPVAVDCVMADVLRAENGQGGHNTFSTPRAYDYMFCAEEAGLGVCEGTRSSPGGNPFQMPYGSGYSEVDYVRQDV